MSRPHSEERGSRARAARRSERRLRHLRKALGAIAEVTIEWLEGERDRVRAGGFFDEEAARRYLGEN